MRHYWLHRGILDPLRRGEPGRYHRYDHRLGRILDRPVEVPVPEVLIADGVFSFRLTTARPALMVYVTAPRPLRLARVFAHDGEEARLRM